VFDQIWSLGESGCGILGVSAARQWVSCVLIRVVMDELVRGLPSMILDGMTNAGPQELNSRDIRDKTGLEVSSAGGQGLGEDGKRLEAPERVDLGMC
jgi:hypothetical protein